MRVLPVAKRKSRRAERPGHFLRKVCRKKQKRLGTRPIRPPQGRSIVGCQRTVTKQSRKKHVFFKKKHVFFHKTQLWLPRGRRPLRVLLLLPLSMRTVSWVFTFVSYTLFHFLVLSRCSLLRRDPRTSFLALFLEGFSDPRV